MESLSSLNSCGHSTLQRVLAAAPTASPGRYVGGNLRPAEGDLAISSPDRDEVLTVVDEPGAANARHSRPTLRIRHLQASNASDRDEDRIVRQLVELLRRNVEQSQASLLLRIGDHALHGAEGKRSSDDPTRRTPKAEAVDEPEERLVCEAGWLLDEAAKALKDDCIGFTLARDFDPREIGLLYYVMASSQTLGDALKRVARYSRITNEALVSDMKREIGSLLV